ncbi:hypothetical protein [Streptomyces sp. NPDC088258]|uniref:hypothetical protein n=1 Tax=Streptomyces sp. NPDC088258 TaxID=3365849 RepID=UPI0037FA9D51
MAPPAPPAPLVAPASRIPPQRGAEAAFPPPHPSYAWAPADAAIPEEHARLVPVQPRHPGRAATALVCGVLGLGLIGGAATGTWLTGDSAAEPAARDSFATARSLWHSVPVDTLFPRTLDGDGAGPGGADRDWTRVGVAPDSDCSVALDPLLLRTVGQVGCQRVLRATYVDATSSSVTTVGLVFTEADAAAMDTLRARFRDEKLDRRADLMPRAFPVEGTPAAGFGATQRASWSVNVLTDAPVVVYGVSGFADGREVTAPQPAGEAMATGATTAPAQSGLGHEAKGVADRIERGFREAADARTAEPR